MTATAQARLTHPFGLSPPFLPSPVPDDAFPAGKVAVSQQRRDINIERGLGPRVGEQLMDGRQGRRDRVDRAPVLARQEGQTDLARGKGDVGMGDPGGEEDGRWGLRIAGGDGDAEMPQAPYDQDGSVPRLLLLDGRCSDRAWNGKNKTGGSGHVDDKCQTVPHLHTVCPSHPSRRPPNATNHRRWRDRDAATHHSGT